MKYWKLLICADGNHEVLNRYFDNHEEIEGNKEIDDLIVNSILSEMDKTFIITDNETLRFYQEGDVYRLKLSITDKMSISEAFKRYGEDAVSEAIDKGSWHPARAGYVIAK